MRKDLSLTDFCWMDGQVFCPRCRARKVYNLKDGRYRCSSCRYTFQDFTGRWINHCSISNRQWFQLTSLFEAGASAAEVSRQLGLTYNQSHKALKIIRLSIMTRDAAFLDLMDGQTEMKRFCRPQGYDGEPVHCMGDHAPVFRLRFKGSGAEVRIVSNLSVKEVMFMPLEKQFFRSMFVCPEPSSKDYLLFSCCSYLRKKAQQNQCNKFKKTLENKSSFWEMCFRLMDNYHRISPESFALYLKEFELRFNFRGIALSREILSCLCSFVPKTTY